MIILEDTRQQPGKHELKHNWWKANGVKVVRSKLIVGDYSFPPSVSVDTKASLMEITQNLCGSIQEKRRFTTECKKAQEIGCKLVFLIETGQVKELEDLFDRNIALKSGQYIPGVQVARAMSVMSERYGVEFIFCPGKKAAEKVIDILESKHAE